MPDSVDRKKYEPLQAFLEALPTSDRDTTLSFDQVEQIIGDTLPPSATAHREWWANQEGGSRAALAGCWLQGGQGRSCEKHRPIQAHRIGK